MKLYIKDVKIQKLYSVVKNTKIIFSLKTIIKKYKNYIQ
jgi:hypothetical protein